MVLKWRWHLPVSWVLLVLLSLLQLIGQICSISRVQNNNRIRDQRTKCVQFLNTNSNPSKQLGLSHKYSYLKCYSNASARETITMISYNSILIQNTLEQCKYTDAFSSFSWMPAVICFLSSVGMRNVLARTASQQLNKYYSTALLILKTASVTIISVGKSCLKMKH